MELKRKVVKFCPVEVESETVDMEEVEVKVEVAKVDVVEVEVAEMEVVEVEVGGVEVSHAAAPRPGGERRPGTQGYPPLLTLANLISPPTRPRTRPAHAHRSTRHINPHALITRQKYHFKPTQIHIPPL